MKKVLESCAATFLFLVLPTSVYGANHKPKRDPVNHADACLDQAQKQNGWAKSGNLVCVINDAKSVESKVNPSSMSGGKIFGGVYAVDINGIPTQRVELDFYQENKDRPAEISVDEWKGRAQTRHNVYPVKSPVHETTQGLLPTFKRAVEKSGALQRLGQ